MARYTAAMINIRPLIQTHIRTQVAAFKEVAGAADLSNVLQGRISDPGCYVFQERAAAESNDSVSGILQTLSAQIAVIIVVRNVKDARGNDAADASFALQNSVQTALLGWLPSPNFQPLEYVSGSLVSFANGFYIWKDSYKTSQFITA